MLGFRQELRRQASIYLLPCGRDKERPKERCGSPAADLHHAASHYTTSEKSTETLTLVSRLELAISSTIEKALDDGFTPAHTQVRLIGPPNSACTSIEEPEICMVFGM